MAISKEEYDIRCARINKMFDDLDELDAAILIGLVANYLLSHKWEMKERLVK